MVMIELITYNVGGLNDKTKRQTLWNNIKQYSKAHQHKTIVWILQETHTTEETAKLWSLELGPEWTFNCSHGETNSKGVGFLMSTSISYNIVQQDNIGRVLELQLNINGHSWTL